MALSCGATVRSSVAGTRTAYVLCDPPQELAALRLRYAQPTQEAGTRSPYNTEAPGRLCELRCSPVLGARRGAQPHRRPCSA
eukprot:scaffold8395_cov69-Phaeocystis_antarctica.AAC.1